MRFYYNIIILLTVLGCRQKDPTIIESTAFTQNDCIFETFTNVYNNNDKVLKKNHSDSNGKLIQQNLQRETNGVLYDSTKYYYHYNKEGYLTQIKFVERYFTKGDTSQVNFEYNTKGYLSKKILAHRNEEFLSTVFGYDNNNKLTKISITQNGISIKEYFYTAGRINKVISTNYDKSTYTINYLTNSLGRITKETYQDGLFWTYSYDEKNNLINSEIYKSSKEKIFSKILKFMNMMTKIVLKIQNINLLVTQLI